MLLMANFMRGGAPGCGVREANLQQLRFRRFRKRLAAVRSNLTCSARQKTC
jgi:hypothetical protein